MRNLKLVNAKRPVRGYESTLLLPTCNGSLKSSAAGLGFSSLVAPHACVVHRAPGKCTQEYTRTITQSGISGLSLFRELPPRGAGESRNCGGRARNNRGIGGPVARLRSYGPADLACTL